MTKFLLGRRKGDRQTEKKNFTQTSATIRIQFFFFMFHYYTRHIKQLCMHVQTKRNERTSAKC